MTDTANITANHNVNVDTKDFAFHFKKDKLGNKRSSIELKLAVPSVEGIINILQTGGKELQLLQDAMYDVIRQQAANIIGEDEKLTADNFPTEKALWTFIANLTKVDRRSNSIPAEQWEAFAKDYIEVMPGVTGKSVEAVTNATVVYLKKFSIVKTNKDVLAKLKEQLALYLEHTKNAEEFQDILELLDSKVDSLLNTNETEMLVNNL